MSELAVVATGLSKSYGYGSSAVTAPVGGDLAVDPGQRLAVVGKSGSGKSTLMNLLGGLDIPTSGTLLVAGRRLPALTRRQLAAFRLATVGFIFQSYHLLPNKSVLENVELPLLFAGCSPHARRARAKELLDAVEMGHRMDHVPSQLSGGERQR